MPTHKSSLVHPPYKKRYRVENWNKYERGLRSRGDVTVWLSDDAVDAWTPKHDGRRGGRRLYSLDVRPPEHNSSRPRRRPVTGLLDAMAQWGPSAASYGAVIREHQRCPALHLGKLLALRTDWALTDIIAAIDHAAPHQAWGADPVQRILVARYRQRTMQDHIAESARAHIREAMAQSPSNSGTCSLLRVSSQRPRPSNTRPVRPTMTTRRPDELLELIREALRELRLPQVAEQLDALVAEGADTDTRLQWLWRLLEPQLIGRRERAAERRVRDARFPNRKSLDNFDFPFQPKLDRQRVLEFATLDFIRRGQNLLVARMSGTGKSHICIAIGYLACAAGTRTRYTTSADMLADLHASLATDSLVTAVKTYTRPQLLIVDEVGLDWPERERGRDAHFSTKKSGRATRTPGRP